jgi:hypothetical protein
LFPPALRFASPLVINPLLNRQLSTEYNGPPIAGGPLSISKFDDQLVPTIMVVMVITPAVTIPTITITVDGSWVLTNFPPLIAYLVVVFAGFVPIALADLVIAPLS